MVTAEQRTIDWGSAQITGAALSVELTGAGSKAWKQRFEGVLALLDTTHGRWGDTHITKKGLQVADVEPDAETELRHFLESIVLEVNSGLAQPEGPPRAAGQEAEADERARADRQMTAAFRAFADN